jgi:hypothetical protein
VTAFGAQKFGAEVAGGVLVCGSLGCLTELEGLVGREKALVVSRAAKGVFSAGGIEGGTMGGSHDGLIVCCDKKFGCVDSEMASRKVMDGKDAGGISRRVGACLRRAGVTTGKCSRLAKYNRH